MPAPYAPRSGEDGILLGSNMFPVSTPLSYIPSKGEIGLLTDNTFLPLEPLYHLPENDEILSQTPMTVNRNAPWTEQSGMTVAPACIEPYNWEQSAVGLRTIVLDTVLDADATPTEKALPGYVPNYGITKILSKTHLDFDVNAFDDEDGVAYLWTFLKAGYPAYPHPTLRTGQTRYPGISGAEVGTAYIGDPFLPATGAALATGFLRVCAYRYGLLLGWSVYEIAVKLGRGKATWNKIAQTLTLEETQTTGCTIKYTLNGGALTTYTVPISITDTGTVVWYAEKSGSITSDTWTTIITYAGVTPPDDFETVYFSAIPAFNNSIIEAALHFQLRADWYVAVGASGDGLTPSTPASATSIFSATTSKAQAGRSITASKSGTADIALARAGANPAGSLMKISTDGGGTFATYAAAVTPTSPGRVHFKLVRADVSDFTRTFVQPWFIGTGAGVQIRAVWDKAAATLTLSYESPQDVTAGSFVVGAHYRILTIGSTDFTLIGAASNTVGEWFTATGVGVGTGTATRLETDDIQIRYSLDGSTPSILYSGPIMIAATCTPKVLVFHDMATKDPHDFATISGTYTCTTIDPAITLDYNETHTATFVLSSGSTTQVHSQGKDVVWCSAGSYAGSFSPGDVIIRGGYNSDFTVRDVKNNHSLFTSYGAFLGELATCDGLYANNAGTSFRVAISFNCHVSFNGNSNLGLQIFPTGVAYFCTVDVTNNVGNGSDAVGYDDYGGFAVGYDAGVKDTEITCGKGPNYLTLFNCTINIAAIVGNGGRGADIPYLGPSYWGQSGAGGNVTSTVTIGGMFGCTVTAAATCGNGGASGSVAAGMANGFDGSPAWKGGGDALAIITTGEIINSSTVTLTATAGTGGDCTASYAGANGGTAPGGGTAAKSITGTVSDSIVTSDAVCGRGGNSSHTINGETAGWAQTLVQSKFGHRGIADLTATAGDGGVAGTSPGSNDGGSLANVISGGECYYPTLTGSATCGSSHALGQEYGWLEWTALPTVFKAGDVTFTESDPTSSGNPVRVDHSSGSTIGWYSGLDNGDGAPLFGYETPQGTGIALGRYFE